MGCVFGFAQCIVLDDFDDDMENEEAGTYLRKDAETIFRDGKRFLLGYYDIDAKEYRLLRFFDDE